MLEIIQVFRGVVSFTHHFVDLLEMSPGCNRTAVGIHMIHGARFKKQHNNNYECSRNTHAEVCTQFNAAADLSTRATK